jgi:ferritin-like metal-binding protein YciE
MPKKTKELKDLFHDSLKDIYFAEKKILATLPKLAKAAQSEELKAGFEKHRAETAEQVTRLEQVFEIIGEDARGKTCPAINGLAEEGAEIIEEYKGSPVIDLGLIGAARSVEHYEMSRYIGLRDLAEQLGHADAVELLQTTLKEEEATDEALATLAEEIGRETSAVLEEEAA